MRRAATLLLCVLSAASAAGAQQVWTGYSLTFQKADFADWTLAQNQDRITDDVWITRANSRGIFNIASEPSYQRSVSPEGTAWAFGRASEWMNLTFEPWEEAVNNFPPGMLNQPLAVHLIDEDIYLDLMFTAWTPGGGGGGFSYIRAVPAPGTLGLLAALAPLACRRRRSAKRGTAERAARPR